MTRLGARRSVFLIPVGAREFLFSEVSTQFLRPTQSPIQYVPRFFQGREAEACEIDHHLI